MEFLVLTKTGGILGPFATALGWIMDGLFKFTSTFGVMNIGLCIILFTLVTRLILFPFTIKQQKSSKLMAVMQPEIQAIQAKYKGKKDQESMMKQNAEIQALYEKYGTSMTGGCLQLVIQMPILFALYRVIYNIPAYVTAVRVYYDNVVNGFTSSGVSVDMLNKFAEDNGVALNRIKGGLEAGADKIVDFLYMLSPDQWDSLERAFPNAAEIIASNAAQIEKMNSFLGINLATTPWQGLVPNIAWIIPILAGLTQWYSTKLMTANQPTNEDAPGANMMKSMNIYMPIMSVVFCFTLPAGIGIYWIAGAVFMVIQQLFVNSYMKKMDIDEMIKKNVEKVNKKRAKKGLPPAKIAQNATANVRALQAKTEQEQKEREEKIAKSSEHIKESTDYYNSNAKPGSLAAKANMVKLYNEKHNTK